MKTLTFTIALLTTPAVAQQDLLSNPADVSGLIAQCEVGLTRQPFVARHHPVDKDRVDVEWRGHEYRCGNRLKDENGDESIWQCLSYDEGVPTDERMFRFWWDPLMDWANVPYEVYNANFAKTLTCDVESVDYELMEPQR